MWLGRIPSHWEVKRLGQLGVFLKGKGGTKEDEVSDGVPCVRYGDLYTSHQFFIHATRRRIDPERAAAYTPIEYGDVLFAASGETFEDIGKSAVSLIKSDARCGGDVIVFRPGVPIEPRFLGYATDCYSAAAQKASMGTGSIIKHIHAGQLKYLAVALPPAREQLAIAAFLDRETAKIDALIAKKEQLIELLLEKRTAHITSAVTRGLDMRVPMKDVGVNWLNEIPAHWEVKRLWHLTPSDRRIMYGIVLPGPNVDDGVLIVKGGDVAAERLSVARLNRTTREIEAGYARSRLRGGDLVYAIRGSIGAVAVVPDELEGANLTQDAARVSYTGMTHGRWLLYALTATCIFAQVEAGAVGATIRGVNIRDLKRASIPVPPRPEQEAIADRLDNETAKLDLLVADVRGAIDRLTELRSALISAAVTGKIDVRLKDGCVDPRSGRGELPRSGTGLQPDRRCSVSTTRRV